MDKEEEPLKEVIKLGEIGAYSRLLPLDVVIIPSKFHPLISQPVVPKDPIQDPPLTTGLKHSLVPRILKEVPALLGVHVVILQVVEVELQHNVLTALIQVE